jgi:hypothetical protein
LVFDAKTHRRVYEIDLEKVTDAAAMLDWVMQIATKIWATPEDLGYLVQAFKEIFHPQQNFCGFALNGDRSAKGTRLVKAYVRRLAEGGRRNE